MIINPCGEQAILVDIEESDAQTSGLSVLFTVLRLRDQVAAWQLPGIVDLVPAASTLLIMLDTAVVLPKDVANRLREVDLSQADSSDKGAKSVVEIPVRYDGPDLSHVAELLEISSEELVRRHTSATWTAAFGGFAPGFAYLVSDTPLGSIPRLDSPRAQIPTGAVGLAGEFSGIYPQPSPGGWQLIGTTDLPMWDATNSERPAAILPGDTVTFVEVK